MKRFAGLVLLIFLACSSLRAQVVSTIAGSVGLTGSANGAGSNARFNNPHGIACDQNGNIFIADRYNHLIRKINSTGVVSTIAGTGTPGSSDGQGTLASFNEPWGIATDTLGNIYVADTKNYKIRKIDATGLVSTLAGVGTFGTTNGASTIASFGFPVGIAANQDGTIIYVADYNTHVIRKITGGIVSNLAGTAFLSGSNDGPGVTATFDHPYGIELDQNGELIVADEWNNKLRRISPIGTVSSIAGLGSVGSTDGSAPFASFNYPRDITVDNLNNIFVLDGYNQTVRRIDHLTAAVTTYVGSVGIIGATDGTGPSASFNGPSGITYNRIENSLLVADADNNTIRKITAVSSVIITLTTLGTSNVCFGDSISFTVSPPGLNSYSIYENKVVPLLLASSSGNILKIAPLSQGVHSFFSTAIDATGATAKSNIDSITILPQFTPSMNAGGSLSICSGDSVQLIAQSGSAYQWSNGATTSTIYVGTAGNYVVTVTNAGGCNGTSLPLAITVLSSPSVSVTPIGSTIICPGDSLPLTGSAGTSWIWSNGATTQNINAVAGTYTLTITASNGCSASSTPLTIANFNVSAPGVNPPGPITILQGDSIQLIASGGTSYQWSNGLSGNQIYANTSGNIIVTSTDNNGCIVSSLPVNITVINSSTMLTALGATAFCLGNNVVLNSYFSAGNQWLFNGNPIPGATAQQLTVYDSGYYSVGVWLNNNWLYSDSINITVYPAPQLATVNDTTACSGSIVQLPVQPQSGITFNWYDTNAGGPVLATGPIFTTPVLTSSVTYYVESQNNYGCVSIDRAGLNVLVKATPEAAFSQTVQPQSGIYNTTFNNSSNNADNYLWIFGDTSIAGNISTEVNPIYAYPAIGDYPVILIATNSYGCIDTLLRTISVNANNPTFLPTTFTPNGDGKNDLFRVRGDNIYLQEMMIYDQWGTMIYHTDGTRPNWDGTVNGKTVQNGTYVYRVRILDKDNSSKELTGSVTLIK